MNLFIRIFDFMSIANYVAIGGIVLAFFVWFFGIRKTSNQHKVNKLLIRTLFVGILLISLLILIGKFAISNMMGG